MEAIQEEENIFNKVEYIENMVNNEYFTQLVNEENIEKMLKYFNYWVICKLYNRALIQQEVINIYPTNNQIKLWIDKILEMSDSIRIENVKEFLDTLTKYQLMYLRWRLYEFADIDSIQNGMINNNDIFSLNDIPDNNEINNPFNGLSKHEYIQNLYNNDSHYKYKNNQINYMKFALVKLRHNSGNINGLEHLINKGIYLSDDYIKKMVWILATKDMDMEHKFYWFMMHLTLPQITFVGY